MDNTYTHSDSTPGCGSGCSKVDLRSFASGFLLASAFFLVPMLMTDGFQASVVEQDIDRDGIADSVDGSFRHPLVVLPVEEVEEEICVPSDIDEDGEIAEDEGCEVDVEDSADEATDTEDVSSEEIEEEEIPVEVVEEEI
jgi:hypothetical protein